MLTIHTIKMPALGQVGRPEALHRGEWEKLSRLCAVIETDGPKVLTEIIKRNRIRWAEKLAGLLEAGSRVRELDPEGTREALERFILDGFQAEGLDRKDWVIQAHLIPNRDEPRDLGAWQVTLWCRRETAPGAVEHNPTISEKTIRERVAELSPEMRARYAETEVNPDFYSSVPIEDLAKAGPEDVRDAQEERRAKLDEMAAKAGGADKLVESLTEKVEGMKPCWRCGRTSIKASADDPCFYCLAEPKEGR